MNKIISIIIPIYNTEKYLDKCLNSCINQTFKDIEIILINDGSTDNSFEICKKYLKIDSRIRLFNQENKGQSFCRNFGIMNSETDFIFFLDSDDYIQLNTLESLYNKIIKDKSDIAIGGWERVNQIGDILDRFPKINENIINSSSKNSYIFSGKISLISCGILFKKNIFIENLLFFPNYAYEDVCLLPKVYYYANKISVVNECLYKWLDRENSTSNQFTMYHANSINSIYNEWLNFLLTNKEFDVIKFDLHRGVTKYLNFAKQKANLVTNNKDIINYLYCLELIINNTISKYELNQSEKRYIFSREINILFSHIKLLKNDNKKIIIYGNGIIGNIYANELINQLVAIVDLNTNSTSKYSEIYHPEKLNNMDFDKIIISVFGRENDIKDYLINELNIDESKIIVFDMLF